MRGLDPDGKAKADDNKQEAPVTDRAGALNECRPMETSLHIYTHGGARRASHFHVEARADASPNRRRAS